MAVPEPRGMTASGLVGVPVRFFARPVARAAHLRAAEPGRGPAAGEFARYQRSAFTAALA